MPAFMSAGIGPHPLFDRPNEGSAADAVADAVVAELKALSSDVHAALTEANHNKSAVAELETRMNGVVAEVTSLHQKAVRSGGGGLPARVTKSFGEMIVGSEKYREFRENRRSQRFERREFETKAFIGSDPDFSVPVRDGLVPLPRRRMTIRNLVSTRSIDSNKAQFLRATGRTSAAAPVAEGALKPQSSYTLALAEASTRVFAHWVECSLQLLDDAPEVAAYIDSELLADLEQLEEAQILFGDGTAENLNGIVTQAEPYALPSGATAHTTSIDQLGNAILQASLTDVPPDGVVLNPADWQRLRTIKDTQGRYLYGPPGDYVEPRIFGLSVVETKAMTVDKFLVGPFKRGATLYEQWAPHIDIGLKNDDFTRNVITIRAEERVALGVKLPKSFIWGDFGLVT